MKKYIPILITVFILSCLFSCASKKLALSSDIEAARLANEYAKDVKTGNKKFKGKYLTIVGKVSQQYKNKYQESIIILMDNKQVNGVKCILNSGSKQLKKPLRQGELIKINGRCTGFDEFVVLRGCIILKN